MIKGHVKILSGDKVIYETDNKVTVEAAEFLANYVAKTAGYEFNKMYGQYGDIVTYPPTTGPFFTPSKTDKVVDMIGSIDVQPISLFNVVTEEGQSTYTNNLLKAVSFFPGNNGSCYIGFGMVCDTGSKQLLLGHISTLGILKEEGASLGIVWEWTFRAPD